MGVAVERENAARIASVARQLEIDVLPVPVTIEFDCDAAFRRNLEHTEPVRLHARPAVENAPARMTENRHAWSADRGKHPIGLIVVLTKERVRRSDDELEDGAFPTL